VTSAKIANGTISNADLSSTGGSEAVDTNVIRDSAVTSAKIADNTIKGSDITTTNADAITAANIQNETITSGKILNGTIVNADISGTAAIDYSKLNLASSIVNTDVAGSAAIAYSKLNLANSITSADLKSTSGSEAVATANIQADAVTAAKVAEGAVPNSMLSFGSGMVFAWTNQPQVRTEFFGVTGIRLQADLGAATSYRWETSVTTASASANTPKVCVQFSTDNGATWTYLDGTADAAANTTTSAACVSIASTGMQKTSFLALPAGAKADVLLRAVGIGGDGTADPMVPEVALEIR